MLLPGGGCIMVELRTLPSYTKLASDYFNSSFPYVQPVQSSQRSHRNTTRLPTISWTYCAWFWHLSLAGIVLTFMHPGTACVTGWLSKATVSSHYGFSSIQEYRHPRNNVYRWENLKVSYQRDNITNITNGLKLIGNTLSSEGTRKTAYTETQLCNNRYRAARPCCWQSKVLQDQDSFQCATQPSPTHV